MLHMEKILIFDIKGILKIQFSNSTFGNPNSQQPKHKTNEFVCLDLSEESSRQYNVACYMSYYPVLEHHVQYQAEPVGHQEPSISTKQVQT